MATRKPKQQKKALRRPVQAKPEKATSTTVITGAITKEWERIRTRIERRLGSPNLTLPTNASHVRHFVVKTASDELAASIRPGRPRD